MTREESIKILFYQGDAVHTVLKRYEFSDTEKKIIQAAIVTAKRENPNIALIDKSDALLKMVATSRETINTEEVMDDLETKIQMSKLKMTGYRQAKTGFLKKPVDKSKVTLIAVLVWGSLVLTANQFFGSSSTSVPAFSNGAEGHLQLYTFEDAQKLCSEKGKVLPLTMYDAIEFLGTPDPFNTKGYWSAKKEVLYNVAQGYGNERAQKYYVVCVDTNGKGIVHY